MIQNKRTSPIQDREIVTQYPVAPVTDSLSGEVGTRAVEITTAHHKSTKQILSTVTYRDLYQHFVTWQTDYPWQTLALTTIAKYSDRALAEQHGQAVRLFESGDFSSITYFPRRSTHDSGALEELYGLVIAADPDLRLYAKGTAVEPVTPAAMTDTEAIDAITRILYPVEDHEWSSDEIEAVAEVIEAVRPGASKGQSA